MGLHPICTNFAVIARSGATKQSSRSYCFPAILDCFASLAMTCGVVLLSKLVHMGLHPTPHKLFEKSLTKNFVGNARCAFRGGLYKCAKLTQVGYFIYWFNSRLIFDFMGV